VGTDVIISPDGTRLVFATRRADGVTRLMTRRLEDFAIIELPGTDGARSPFFSPDGRWVGFLASGKLQKVAVDGGLPVALADAVDLLGASWGEDGRIIAALSFGKLVSVPSSPAASTVVVDLAHERIEPRWPQILPDGRHVLFTAVGPPGANRANIEVLSLTDLKRTILVRGGTYGRYLPAGFLTYVNQGALFAQPFDVAQMTTSGTATVILDGISYSPTFGFAQLDISRTGTLVYRRSPARGQLIAAWLDRSGRAEPLPMKPGQYTFPRLSPDRRRVAAMVTESGTGQLVIYDRELDHTKRLPATPSNYSPVWSPDGTFLLLGGPGGIRWTKTDTVESLVSLTRKGAVQIPWSFTSDGTRLAYHEFDASTGFDLWTVPLRRTANGLAAAGEPEPFLRTPAFETYPSFSPDDRWVAYASGDYGRWEVYVRPFPDTGAVPVKISEAGGRIAKWLPDGPSLLYRTDDHRIMVTTYTVKNGTFVADVPRQWMPGRLADTDVLSNFDLNPDDQRIVGLLPARPEDQQSPSHATVILNFFDSVRRRMSANGT
jgi:serine/threonine-protein kinase